MYIPHLHSLIAVCSAKSEVISESQIDIENLEQRIKDYDEMWAGRFPEMIDKIHDLLVLHRYYRETHMKHYQYLLTRMNVHIGVMSSFIYFATYSIFITLLGRKIECLQDLTWADLKEVIIMLMFAVAVIELYRTFYVPCLQILFYQGFDEVAEELGISWFLVIGSVYCIVKILKKQK